MIPHRKKQKPENALQADIVGFLRAVLIPSETIIYANANAARRTYSGKAANGVPGLLPGIPDLSLVTIGGRIHYIEVKASNGSLSIPQEEIIGRFIRMGVPYVVARGIDDVKAALEHWRIRTREAREVA